jgi:hypothetical protein
LNIRLAEQQDSRDQDRGKSARSFHPTKDTGTLAATEVSNSAGAIMTLAIRSLILILCAAAGLAAQDGTDFSGRWVLVSPSQPGPDVPRALSVRQELVRTNVRGEPMKPFFKSIAIDREFESGTRSETQPIGIIGGVVSGIPKDDGPRAPSGHHAVKWDLTDLVFESGSYTGTTPGTGEWSERREVWSVQPDGRLRVAITTAGSNERSTTVTLGTNRGRRLLGRLS